MTMPLSAELPVCVFIATGGTIAMTLDPHTNAAVPALSGSELIASVPGLANIARLEVDNLSNLPSVEIGPQCWATLHRSVTAALGRDNVQGVLIAHGTDTLEETAWFLDLTLNSPKPVVLVGAQRNACASDFDGPRNLLAGARVCVSAQARNKGVLVVLNDHINAARDVSKTHTTNVHSFTSGAAGFIGSVDADSVAFRRSPGQRQHFALENASLPRVDIVPMYAGADGALLNALVHLGVKGTVIQALGAGNVNTAMYESVLGAIALGIVVVVATRVAHGRVQPLYGFPGGGKTLQDAGAIFAGDLSPQKARILLMLALQVPRSNEELQQIFEA